MAISLIVAIIGGVLYALFSFTERAEPGKELSRLAFFAGLLAYLLGAVR